jgi:hypothetical protein
MQQERGTGTSYGSIKHITGKNYLLDVSFPIKSAQQGLAAVIKPAEFNYALVFLLPYTECANALSYPETSRFRHK